MEGFVGNFEVKKESKKKKKKIDFFVIEGFIGNFEIEKDSKKKKKKEKRLKFSWKYRKSVVIICNFDFVDEVVCF